MKASNSIIWFALVIFLFAAQGYGEEHKEHGEDHEERKLPEGVLSFHDEEKEFSLRPNVITNFGISYAKVQRKNGHFEVPKSSLVQSLNEVSIFVFSDKSFRSVKVTVIGSSETVSTVTSAEDLAGVDVVTRGTPFLQTVLRSLEEGPSEGHGH